MVLSGIAKCYINHEFAEKVKQMGEELNKYTGNKIVVVHHNDADGICSAAILLKLFELLGYEVELICIEKVHPSIVDAVHSKNEGNLIVYTDLAGLAAKMIDEVNNHRCKVWIIDHHPAKAIESDDVFVFDPELFGISGDTFVCASSLNYLIAICIKEEMKKYAYLAVAGAVGDYHDRTGGVLGFDRCALDDALLLNQATIKIKGYKERYYLNFFEEYADVVAERLTILGAVGYEERGYAKGVKACLNGFDDKTIKEVERLKKLRDEKFEEAIKMLRGGGLHIEKYTQWFHLKNSFSPMGVKAVGEFCEKIKDMTFIEEDKYILGFQNCPDRIPDIGKIDWNVVKVSARAPFPLGRKILKGEVLGFDVLIPAASEVVGGVADATHRIAAATLIEKGKEEEFIRAFEDIVEKSRK